MSGLLEVTGLRVRFRALGTVKALLRGVESPFVEAVAGVDLALAEGETLALVGESGSGKTTLARALIGLLPVEAGSVRFRSRELIGQSSSAWKAVRREMAMMFQDPVGSLSPRLTVRALVTEPYRIHGLRGRETERECARLLGLVGLPPDFGERYPHQLSGGQARRVGVARALALDPRLILADEPTAGLDVSVQGEILNLLARLQDQLGLSILIITHNLNVVRHVADRTAIMYLGRIVEQGETERVFAHPRHPYTEALLSANPQADPAARHRRIELKGEVPSLLRRPSGCEFHPRCPHARPLCATAAPAATTEGRGRFTCHFPLAGPSLPSGG